MWVQAKMDTPLISFVSLLSGVTFLLLIPGDSCVDIIGGNEVSPHSRPYMALITSGKQICGGALIKKDWVITAAHCSIERKTQVVLGAHSKSKKEPEKQTRSVKKEFPYQCYDKETHEGDLKLLQLNEEVKITKAVDVLALPKSGKDVKQGTDCQVAGWGKTDVKSKKPSDTLREVNVTVIDRKTCNDKDHYNLKPFIGPNMICAGNTKGGKDSCNGDSGGPLICQGSFTGITSFGSPGKCGDPQKPGVYTFLSAKYINWIKNTIKGAYPTLSQSL
ncbi:granzyme A [Dromiciops gliroides]|uniref:granzyme A n=1 Tax=Dromiciops gliroides TaxID=33562 RepID=UPI001CC50B73|nr:granzyme A [Dromiciops gliroides]